MKLTNLGMKCGEADDAPAVESQDAEYFPSLYLCEKQIADLGIDSAKVGAEMRMIATVRLSSLTDSKGGGRAMTFEITQAAIGEKDGKADASSVLFPNG